ncbi:MAG: hypothetical protein QM709_01750 [Spongiibacteraceae bacterium]
MRKLIATLIVFFIATIAHAAIVSSATGTSFASGSSTVSSFTLNRPSSVNVGDLLFVQITVSSSVTVNTVPSGWTQLDDDSSTGGGNTLRQFIYYRVATSSDTAGASTSWGLSASTNVVASMTGYRSDLGGRSVVLGTSSSTTGNGTAMTAPAMTATAPGRLLRFYGHRSTNSLTSTTLTTHVSAAANSSATLFSGSRAISGAGTTTTDIINATSSARFVIHSVLLTESTLSKPTTCYSDSFSSTTAFGQNWVTTSVGSTAFTPMVTGGRLRLTSNNGNISTAATLQRLFPTSNLIYVEFDYYAYPNSGGADGIAVTLSDASITPQAGGFGGSLGYAQRSDGGGINGFAGGWVGIALDEYGNYSNPTEGRNGGPGFRVDSVAIRGSGSGLTGYPYLAGTAANLNPGVDSSTTPGPGHRYRIVIDAAAAGQTYVTVDRDTTGAGTSYTNLIPTFNVEGSAAQATIPANLMLSFTGSTGGSTNTHEIGNLSVCASTINTTNQVDHFEITHDGQGLTCEAENVTIRACANADCSTLMSVPVTANLNPSGGWSSNPVTFTGSTTLQLRQTTAGTAAISIASSSPGAKPFSTNKCNGVNNNTCNLPFVNAGLAFDVPNLLANKPSGAVRLRAVRNSGDASNSCVALFQNTTQAINFWSTYTTPTTGTRAVELRSGSGSGTFAGISGNSASPTALNLNFDANGETTFEARYQDAGLMALNAQYNGSGTYAGLVLSGSDSFVSTPAGFCVRGAQTSAPTTYLSCTSNYSNCSAFAPAGNNFVLNIAAASWESDTDTDFCTGNGTTPNYQQNNLGLGSAVIAPTAANPSNNINGAVSPQQFNLSATNNGVVSPTTISNVTESEVGVFEFVVTAPNYNGVAVPSGKNLPIGRFIPHHFGVSADSLINRSTSCPLLLHPFTYIGENLNLNFTLSAQNASNAVTQNYKEAFMKLDNSYAGLNVKAIYTPTAPLVTPIRTSFTPTFAGSEPAAPFANGEAQVNIPIYINKPTTPIGPFTPTAFGIAPQDSDGVTVTGLNLDTDAPAVTPIVNDHRQVGNTTELRYGRLRLDSMSGPANLPLAIPMTTEYWNGTGFITNLADTSCTTIAINNSTVTLGPYSGNLNSGETGFANTSGFITSGKASSLLQLNAPGNGNEGSVGVSFVNPWPWLQIDWNGDGSLDGNVSATASFGTYRGSDRIIFWLETQ